MIATAALRRQMLPDVGDLRIASGVMLAAAVLLPELPHHPGLPCPLRTLTGVPCPLCGMTTSVEATVRGHLGAALHANPAGIAAVAAAVLIVLLRPRGLRIPALVPCAVLAAMWIFELWRFALI
jgi:Protein of unknown function (DUF2752)